MRRKRRTLTICFPIFHFPNLPMGRFGIFPLRGRFQPGDSEPNNEQPEAPKNKKLDEQARIAARKKLEEKTARLSEKYNTLKKDLEAKNDKSGLEKLQTKYKEFYDQFMAIRNRYDTHVAERTDILTKLDGLVTAIETDLDKPAALESALQKLEQETSTSFPAEETLPMPNVQDFKSLNENAVLLPEQLPANGIFKIRGLNGILAIGRGGIYSLVIDHGSWSGQTIYELGKAKNVTTFGTALTFAMEDGSMRKVEFGNDTLDVKIIEKGDTLGDKAITRQIARGRKQHPTEAPKQAEATAPEIADSPKKEKASPESVRTENAPDLMTAASKAMEAGGDVARTATNIDDRLAKNVILQAGNDAINAMGKLGANIDAYMNKPNELARESFNRNVFDCTQKLAALSETKMRNLPEGIMQFRDAVQNAAMEPAAVWLRTKVESVLQLGNDLKNDLTGMPENMRSSFSQSLIQELANLTFKLAGLKQAGDELGSALAKTSEGAGNVIGKAYEATLQPTIGAAGDVAKTGVESVQNIGGTTAATLQSSLVKEWLNFKASPDTLARESKARHDAKALEIASGLLRGTNVLDATPNDALDTTPREALKKGADVAELTKEMFLSGVEPRIEKFGQEVKNALETIDAAKQGLENVASTTTVKAGEALVEARGKLQTKLQVLDKEVAELRDKAATLPNAIGITIGQGASQLAIKLGMAGNATLNTTPRSASDLAKQTWMKFNTPGYLTFNP